MRVCMYGHFISGHRHIIVIKYIRKPATKALTCICTRPRDNGAQRKYTNDNILTTGR